MNSRPLRVLMVSQRLPPRNISGAPMQALGLSRALKRLGVDVEIATTRLPNEPDVTPSDLLVEDLHVRSFALKPSQFAVAAAHVVRRRNDFDIVHGHAVSAATIGSAAGARAVGLPVLLKPSLGGKDGDLAKVRSARSAPILIRLLGAVDRYVALSDEITRELEAIGVAGRITAVRGGVDFEQFYPVGNRERAELKNALGLKGRRIALFVGQLVPRKGIRPLLEAWQKVRSAEPDFTLVVVGEGPEVTRVEQANVRYLGPRQDVPQLMRVADALVLPSVSEGCPNVVTEAWASGVPAVVGKGAVPRSFPSDPGVLRLVDVSSTEKIAEALLQILRAADETIRDRARDLAAPFDFNRIAETYLALYQQMRRQI